MILISRNYENIIERNHAVQTDIRLNKNVKKINSQKLTININSNSVAYHNIIKHYLYSDIEFSN